MRKTFIFALLCMLSLTAAAKDYHYTTVPGDLTQTRIYHLDNGLTVYLSGATKSLVLKFTS